MPEICYKEVQIETFTNMAYREVAELGMGLYDVKEILEDCFDCPRSKRRKGVEEKCIKKRGQTIKVVVDGETKALPGVVRPDAFEPPTF